MSRLSREKKREQQQAAHAANLAAMPIDVRVPGAGGAGTGGASVGGVAVIAGPGEEIQQAVLNRLHRIAIASGHAVLATVHDERIGYVVPLQVDPDGSSHFTGRPAPIGPVGNRTSPHVPQPTPGAEPVRGGEPVPGSEPGRPSEPGRGPQPTTGGPASGPESVAGPQPTTGAEPVRGRGPALGSGPGRQSEHGRGAESVRGSQPTPDAAPVRGAGPVPGTLPVPGSESTRGAEPVSGSAPAPGCESDADRPTHLLRPVPEPDAPAEPDAVRDATPTYKLRPVPEPRAPRDAVPTFELRAVPGQAEASPPGTVVPPTGEFGPPPPMDVRPHPTEQERESEPDPDPKPTPPRGFDAVAEAVLGDEPPAGSGENHLAEPMARVNDAVRSGRIDTAARLAEETVAEASATLGPEHPEVLRLRELTAYIAYLAGEPLRAFRLSLDLALICRRAQDAEAAYGNVRSAATAWRAVRDPLLGLELGHELIALWTELTAEGGPAADEMEELESARARMGRLTERARTQRS
ncbi:hypothetical protein GCM10010297_60720 [Streptomyces malachitofuscus]|nr:hypothetical protein GCM10010297_60720 [Streptomyces malachitofuscus]